MEIQRQYPVGAGAGDQIGDELCRDRHARPRFAVLAGIPVIRKDRRHPPRRAALQRVERDQQLHQMIVRRIGCGLDDKNILAADVLVDLDKHLHIGKPPHAGPGKRLSEIGGDRLGERAIAVAGQDFHRPAGKSAALGPDPAASRKCRCNKPARPKQSEPVEDSLPATNWMTLVRPSRRPLCGLLRMRFFLNSIINLPHPEERPKGASRRTHDAHAAPN